MSGKLKAVAFVSLALALAFALFSVSRHDADADFGFTYGTALIDSTPFANTDSTAPFNVVTAVPIANQNNANFAKLDTSLAPPGFNPVMDGQVPDGAKVGEVGFTATLGIINGVCNTPVSGAIEVMDSTTNVFDTANFEGSGINLVFDDDGVGAVTAEDTNDVPTYADDYPSFLNALFDPDGIGATAPIRPRFRYSGHIQVLSGASPTILNLVGFNPGDLSTLPLPEAALNDEFGYVNFVILGDPTAPAAPSTITDFCATDSDTDLEGATTGQLELIDPAGPGGPAEAIFQPEVTGIVIQCGNSADNDGDTVADDGCLTLDGGTNAGIVRVENPAAGTGIYGGSTHVYRALGQSYRDSDGDNISNDMDPCPVTVDTVPPTDGDSDGLGACDPVPGTSSPIAPAPDTVNQDGDALTDEDPVNNNDDDGDTLLDEDGECRATSGTPDEDTDCYPNRGDNCALAGNDNSDLDGTIPAGSPADGGPQLDAIGDACEAGANAPVGESGAGCAAGNTADNAPADGRVNDGCPTVAPRPEVGAECLNNTNDDGDASGATAVVNDGCPAAGGGLQNGTYIDAIDVAYACVGATDTDLDGVCNSEETLLGSMVGTIGSTPEYYGLEYDPLTTLDGDICTNRVEYPAGAAVDDDLDGLANAADTGAGATCGSSPVVGIGADIDRDGVAEDGSDNCPLATGYNPSQTNTDGDGSGDACDTDDDDDTIADRVESFMGTDPKDNCSDVSTDPANPSDADNTTTINVGDVTQLFGGGKILVAPPNVLYQARSDFDGNQAVNVGDVTIGFGGGKILTDCDLNISAGAWSLPDNDATIADCANPLVLEFSSKVINLPAGSITDGDGGTWSDTSGEGTSNLIVVTRAGAAPVGDCTISVDDINARRTPTLVSANVQSDVVDGVAMINPPLNQNNVKLERINNGQEITIVVNIINGLVDIDGGGVGVTDDATNVILRARIGNTVNRVLVNIIDGQIDVNRDGVINAADALADVLLNVDP